MKNIIAVFCALIIAPTLNTYAWVGGPFSNNSYFSQSGDDGVYEAIATGPNAIGIYRITVANDFGGSQTQGTGQIVPPGAGAINVNGNGNVVNIPTTSGVNSGNIFIGGFGFEEGPASNIWFYQGVGYFGRAIGTVNSTLSRVTALGNAKLRGANFAATTGPQINSSFTATLNSSIEFLPAAAFSGVGTAGTQGLATNSTFTFTVLGSKVSSAIRFGL